jgi:hypothetical protein
MSILADYTSAQPSIGIEGTAIQSIDSKGAAKTISIINQILTGLIAVSGTVTAADTILQAIQKLAGTAPTAYGSINVSANHQFLASETLVIMDSNNKIGTLPAANATGVIPGVTTYTLKMGTGAILGTLAVPVGESLDGTLNGTFAIHGAHNSQSAQSNGITWYLV